LWRPSYIKLLPHPLFRVGNTRHSRVTRPLLFESTALRLARPIGFLTESFLGLLSLSGTRFSLSTVRSLRHCRRFKITSIIECLRGSIDATTPIKSSLCSSPTKSHHIFFLAEALPKCPRETDTVLGMSKRAPAMNPPVIPTACSMCWIRPHLQSLTTSSLAINSSRECKEASFRESLAW
jgi:hypothetical protein